MNKKWAAMDIIVLIFQIIAPVVSIIITIVIPAGKELGEDIKLSIISGGIVVPIILLQLTLVTGQNKSEKDIKTVERNIKTVENNIKEISDKVDHVSPILEQVFMSDNDRIKRFAYRRIGEVKNTITQALSNSCSEYLRPSEYYEELLYLAELIIADKNKYGKKFTGEVWAMTSFAEDEWIEDVGYEKLWTEKLRELVDKKIKTRRLCVVPDEVYKIILENKFKPPENACQSYTAFIELLKSYYTHKRNAVAEHFCLSSTDNKELLQIKGFFAIKLTNGELHILYGETVNESGALTAKVLFNPSQIKRVRVLFERYTQNNYRMENVIVRKTKQNGFIDYLKALNIEL